MKKSITIILSIFLGFFSACSDDDKNDDEFDVPALTDANTVSFTVKTTGSQAITIYAGGEKVAINWGDGAETKYRIPLNNDCKHTYRSAGTYEVKIWAEHLTFLSIQGLLQNFSGLKTGHCPRLTDLTINTISGIKDLKIADCPALETLNVGNFEDLTSLDISDCKNLKILSCYTHPKLQELDLSHNTELIRLMYSGIPFQSLNLDNNLKLQEFEGSFLDIQELDVRKNLNLKVLICFSSKLNSILVNENNEITSLACYGNKLTTLDLTAFPYLTILNCSDNSLTELDISPCPRLNYLECNNNELTGLYISNPSLYTLYCKDNKLEADALNRIFTALPTAAIFGKSTPPPAFRSINFKGNPGEASCDPSIIKDKGWMVQTN